jgi:hypothetical protein
VKIVELENELSELHSKLVLYQSIWFPMWVDWDKHPLNNEVSFIYIWVEGEGYILPFNHVDCLSISHSQFQTLTQNIQPIWVFGKKRFLHSFTLGDVRINDVVGALYVQTNEVLDYMTPIYGLFTEGIRNGYGDNLPQTTPIYKLGEIISGIIQKNNPLDLDTTDGSYKWLNDTVIPILQKVETAGILVDIPKYKNRYSPKQLKHLNGDTLYTEYNPYHLTGRPSNRYGGINFSALNKEDGTREVFISKGAFLNVDYDAYHLRLISKLIGYELPKTSAHQYFAEQYGSSYDESKGITFQLLYGGIPDEFLSIPYFHKTAHFINELWDKSIKSGYIQTPYRRIPLKFIENPNPQKVFNYLLQSVETERNMKVLSEVLDFIDGMDVRLVLYVYDSFLFDFEGKPTKEWMNGLMGIMERGGFPIKVSWGTDYGKI